MTAAVALSFGLAYVADEEVAMLGLFIATSVVYPLLFPDLPRRHLALVLASCGMPLLGLCFAYVTSVIDPARTLSNLVVWPYHLFFLAGLGFAVAAMKKIEPDEPHLLQIILIPLALLFWFHGYMVIVGDWL
jgi:predicted small integral membrane protein